MSHETSKARWRPGTGALAAILVFESLGKWGQRGSGGDSSAVQDCVRSVQLIQVTHFAFAAILDGRDITGGTANRDGEAV